jgi:hypothetical protein
MIVLFRFDGGPVVCTYTKVYLKKYSSGYRHMSIWFKQYRGRKRFGAIICGQSCYFRELNKAKLQRQRTDSDLMLCGYAEPTNLR